MRLVDIDALDRAMYHKSFEVDDGRNVWNSGLWIRYKIYEEASREAPTIEAVPVRHGKWIKEIDPEEDCWKEEVVYCSCCKEPIRVSEEDNTYFLPTVKTLKYCPNCGAKMDGEYETD